MECGLAPPGSSGPQTRSPPASPLAAGGLGPWPGNRSDLYRPMAPDARRPDLPRLLKSPQEFRNDVQDEDAEEGHGGDVEGPPLHVRQAVRKDMARHQQQNERSDRPRTGETWQVHSVAVPTRAGRRVNIIPSRTEAWFESRPGSGMPSPRPVDGVATADPPLWGAAVGGTDWTSLSRGTARTPPPTGQPGQSRSCMSGSSSVRDQG